MKGFKPFEKSAKDKDPKGMREGSRKDMALDKKQMKSGKPPMFKKK